MKIQKHIPPILISSLIATFCILLLGKVRVDLVYSGIYFFAYILFYVLIIYLFLTITELFIRTSKPILFIAQLFIFCLVMFLLFFLERLFYFDFNFTEPGFFKQFNFREYLPHVGLFIIVVLTRALYSSRNFDK